MIQDIIHTYLTDEKHDYPHLNEVDSIKYFNYVNENGYFVCEYEGNTLIGYMEVWRLEYSQLCHLMSDMPFCIYDEQLRDGPICFISNYFVVEGHRNKDVHRKLEWKLYKEHGDFAFLAYKRQERFTGVKIYSFDKAFRKWIREEKLYGRV